ncbi:MAG TPA: hypothetical protein VMU04_05305, partial [Candidatus Acidoferrum sp.]|nr:hypothetical protein [Candidatus Acidoferrum sp.]
MPLIGRPKLRQVLFLGILLWPVLCLADSKLNHPGYTLTWHDEFDGTTLNPSKWQVALGGNNANNEWEIYAAPNVYVTNGTLVLKS